MMRGSEKTIEAQTHDAIGIGAKEVGGQMELTCIVCAGAR